MNLRIDIHRNNLFEHGIVDFEAKEALLDGWSKRRKDGEAYEVLGRTEDGRYLQLVVEIKTEMLDEKPVKYIWLFHGRDMTESEKRRYNRK